MTSAEKLLCELIALPSVNPAFLPENDPRAGEQRIGDFLAATLAKAGFDIEFQEVLPGRNNLLARLSPAAKPKCRILLAPHMDTVNAPDDMLAPRRKNGRIYGRGACDTKGSIAAIVTALVDLATKGKRPSQTEIIFAGIVDEETVQSGSRALAKRLRADLAIVGEPTQLKVVTAHKGSIWLKFETHGKAAHGSRPDLGDNAVHKMARVVDVLETRYAAQLRKHRHRLLGCATISVGSIQGGSQPNIVPDHCVMTADRRTLPGETEAAVYREIHSLLRQRGLKATLSHAKPHVGLPLQTTECQPLVQRFLAAAGQKKGSGVDYFCDASVFSRAGTPAIVFGPGDIAQAHTADEWISLRSLESGRQIFGHFLQSLS